MVNDDLIDPDLIATLRRASAFFIQRVFVQDDDLQDACE